MYVLCNGLKTVLQRECCSFALIVLTFCLSLVFLYFWSEARNDYNDFDWFVSHKRYILNDSLTSFGSTLLFILFKQSWF